MERHLNFKVDAALLDECRQKARREGMRLPYVICDLLKAWIEGKIRIETSVRIADRS